MAGLALPVIVLTLLSPIMAHFLAQVCFLAAPPADTTLTTSLVVTGVLSFTVALLFNGLRTLWGTWHIYHRSWLASAGFQARVRCCAAEVGVRRAPKVRVTVDLGPWALVTGLLRPQVVLSTGLLALLDAEELDAVLCHELIHLRQGDMLRTIVAGALHDLSWFIPPARRLYALLRMEQELACDDALHEESRRLALASARARVWQAGLSGPPVPRNALTLLPTGPRSSLEWRVRRLEPRIIEEAVPSSGTG